MMEFVPGALLAAGTLFVLWKVYLFIAWNMGRTIFFRGIRCYFQEKNQRGVKSGRGERE